MYRTKEKGVTLMALVITVVLILILSSIGITAGMSTIDRANFSQFKSELKILQTKVNELNQNNEFNKGQALNESQKEILKNTTISNIIYDDGETEEEKSQIQNGFRYYNAEYIKDEFNLDSVKRDYIINVEYRYVICYQGFEYDGNIYYMPEQIEDGLYNVKYTDKNPKEGDFGFDVSYTKENDKWKIEVSNIVYTGYINNWQVEYKLYEENEWKKANGLSFYVSKAGNYYVKVSYGDISLGSKLVSIIDETNQ